MVQALPTQVAYEKRAEGPGSQLSAPPNDTSKGNGELNNQATYAGAAILGALGVVIGGVIGSYMPPNTTLTIESITKGLQSEMGLIQAYVDSFRAPGTLGTLTSWIPLLGDILSSHPGLQPGTPDFGASFIPSAPPPPVSQPKAEPAKQVPKAPTAAPPVPAAPAASSKPHPATPTSNTISTPSNQAQRGPRLPPAVPSTPAMPEAGGHSHGRGSRR